MEYGRWTVVSEPVRENGRLFVRCKCKCGTERNVSISRLKAGRSKSCGCLSAEITSRMNSLKNFKHGMAITATWKIWNGMIQRCSEKATGKNRRWYYDRGIRVCDRWQDYLNFLADMGDRPVGMQIDRINNDDGYNPENWRWTIPTENARNTRHNTVLTLNGESHPICVWAEIKGWPRHVICNRLQYGWPVERVLTHPVRVLSPRKRSLNPDTGMLDGIEAGPQ